jgi:hypothetical protein
MTTSSVACSVTFKSAAGIQPSLATVCAGGIVTGLQEDNRYIINVHTTVPCRLFLDDVEIRKNAAGCYEWTPNFFAGRVTAAIVEPSGQEHTFLVDVSPASKKVGFEQFDAMLDDIRSFDTTLLLGTSAAAMGFGREGRLSRFEPLVQLARLRQHGPGFLAAVREITRVPQQFLRPASQTLPLSRIRRLHPSSLQDRRLAALAAGHLVDGESLESVQLLSQSPVLTVDTPANRTLMTLLRRFRAVVGTLVDKTEALSLAGSPEDQAQRKERRLELLGMMGTAANKLLDSYPFTEVTKVETTAAGLTQIAAHPLYGRAFRKGTEALRLAVDGTNLEDLLHVSPSWGIYETWCFIRVIQALTDIAGHSLQFCKPSAATAELAFNTTLADAVHLELLFQATFTSESPSDRRCAWSLSRERRPDIVLVATRGTKRRFLVLDSKYRSGRDNVLDAMASAHIYHDGLRIDSKAPDLCLLLLPGKPAVPSLEEPSFWNTHRVGALSEFSVGAHGVHRGEETLRLWLDKPAG